MWCFALGRKVRWLPGLARSAQRQGLLLPELVQLFAICTWCSWSARRQRVTQDSPSEVEPVVWQQMGPQAVCATEGSWRPSLVAARRFSDRSKGASKPKLMTFSRGRHWAGENLPGNGLGLSLSHSSFPLPNPLPFLGFSYTVTSTPLPDLTASSSPPPRYPQMLVPPHFFLRTR